jgi:hypothetical protein
LDSEHQVTFLGVAHEVKNILLAVGRVKEEHFVSLFGGSPFHESISNGFVSVGVIRAESNNVMGVVPSTLHVLMRFDPRRSRLEL